MPNNLPPALAALVNKPSRDPEWPRHDPETIVATLRVVAEYVGDGKLLGLERDMLSWADAIEGGTDAS